MKTTSQDYKDGMAESFRRRSHLKITLTTGGQTYTFADDVIASATRTSDVDPLSRKLPTESFDFSIIDFSGEYNPANPSGVWEDIDENAEITVQFGFDLSDGTTEWLAGDVYLLSGKPAVSGGIATFKATSRLRHLSQKFYKGVYGTQTLLALAQSVLQEAGVTSYSLDASLGDFTTDTPLPIDECQNLLQMIAHAAGCALFTSGDVITIKPLDLLDLDYNADPLSLRDIALNGDAVSKIEPLYKVAVIKYTNDVADEPETLSTTTVDVDGSVSYHCEFDAATDISVSVDGGTISNLATYAQAVDCTITATHAVVVTITGKKIIQSSDIADHIAGTDVNGGIDTEKNILVTNEATRSSMINRVSEYLSLRLTHTFTYRGRPEVEAMDGIYYATTLSDFSAGLILATKIQYNGAISGQLIVKALSQDDASAKLIDSLDYQIQDSTGADLYVIGTEDYHSDYMYIDMDDFVSAVLGN